jgi:hypothetical protein
MEKILDFSEALDVALFDQVVGAAYGNNPAEVRDSSLQVAWKLAAWFCATVRYA